MSNKSAIEWTDSSWNPVTGCTKISSGCLNCYAEKLSHRLYRMNPNGKYRNKFKLTLHPKDLEIPLKWKKRKTIFVNSMSDLFHKDVPFSFIKKVFDVMERADWHIFQVLTKRPERMIEFTNKYYNKKLSNVWLGTSVENINVIHRLDLLKQVKANIRFLSIEPLIGPLGKINLSGIHWVIVGGESGKNHRPIKKEWIVEIRDQCNEQQVPFFFKQWGGITSKSGGRELEGTEYSEYPKNFEKILVKIK